MKRFKVTAKVKFTMTSIVAADTEEHARAKMDNFLSDTLKSKVFQDVVVETSIEEEVIKDGR